MNKITKLIPYGASALAFALTLSLALLLLPACTRENPVTPLGPEPEPEAEVDAGTGTPVVLTAIYSPETRTSYSNDEENNFSWDEGDEIAVYTSDNGFLKGTLELSTDPARATVTLQGSGTRSGIAFYPCPSDMSNIGNLSCSVSGTEYILYYDQPTYYDITGKSDNWSPLPLYAMNDGSITLAFKHICAMLRLECNNLPIGTQYIQVYLSTNAPIWGNHIGVNFDTNGVLVPWSNGDSNYITYKITISPLSAVESGFILNIPLSASNYSGQTASYSSFTISALGSDQSTVISSTVLNANLTSVQPGQGFHKTVSFN